MGLIVIIGQSSTKNAVYTNAQAVTSSITASFLGSGTGSTTTSISVNANNLALIWVGQGDGTLGPPTLTDPKRTWVQVITNTAGLRRITLFRSMVPQDTAGEVSISGSASNLTWSIVSYNNVDTSGTNGSGSIVQFGARNYKDAGVGLTSSGDITLADSTEASSAVVGGFFMHWNARPLIAGPGFTLSGSAGCYVLCVQPEFRNDFTKLVNMSWSNSSHWLVIAAELKAMDLSGAVCGNGFIEGNEQCDDSNTASCDGCSASCQNESQQTLYQDLDIDTYGNTLLSQNSYCPVAGFVSNNMDCDDSLATGTLSSPSIVESTSASNCTDSLDNDCDGKVDSADSGCIVSSITYVVGSLTSSCTTICSGAGKTCNLIETNANTNTLPSCLVQGQDVKRFSDNVCGNVQDGCSTTRSIAGERSCACQ